MEYDVRLNEALIANSEASIDDERPCIEDCTPGFLMRHQFEFDFSFFARMLISLRRDTQHEIRYATRHLTNYPNRIGIDYQPKTIFIDYSEKYLHKTPYLQQCQQLSQFKTGDSFFQEIYEYEN